VKTKVELTFPGELKEEAIICTICKKFDVIVNIVEASFSTGTGWAILVFEGAEGEIQKAFQFLKSKNVAFEDVQETI
jgi:ABC-type methionine transport system ATPase subunit